MPDLPDIPSPERGPFGRILCGALLAVVCVACSGDAPASGPVHLELRLHEATYDNSDLPDVRPEVRMVKRDIARRRSVTTYTPGRLTYRVEVPVGGRLHFGMATSEDGDPVTFIVEVDGRAVFQEQQSAAPMWESRSVDLAEWSGRRIELSLIASSDRSGGEANWGTPTITGSRAQESPNVILYVIDAAGADYMSLYGHERTTTPFLDGLAAEGVVFERAYSNSSWTKISTPSFLSSLQSTSLGGYRGQTDLIPEGVTTLPELLHSAGYATGEITSNPFAGSMTGLERGLDFMRDSGIARNAVSSVELHANFWQWREWMPVWPYWAHFQTTDVHWPWDPEPPYLGTFTSAEERERFYEQELTLARLSGLTRPQWLHVWRYPPEVFEEAGIDRLEFFSVAERLYDESMLHNDAQLQILVRQIRERGDWDNTILIITSDHSSAHGLGAQERILPRDGPIMSSMRTRIPLLVIWPGRVQGGRRVQEPVSMVDILPTVLDLIGEQLPVVVQGHSFAPLLRGESWQPVPVTLDETHIGEDGSAGGWLEVIDGTWGASWRFLDAAPESEIPASGIWLCDLSVDLLCLDNVAEQHPEIVDRFVTLLQQRWDAGWVLAARNGEGESSEMTQEQADALRALGYIQ